MPEPPLAGLRRILARPAPAPAPPPIERCELCGQALEPRHEHLLDLASRQIACSCTGCSLLFEDLRAARRRLPRDSRYLAGFEIEPAEWASLRIPIQLAFISLNSRTGVVAAAYPSPAGAVAAAIPAEVWSALAARHPELASLAPDLEALLLNRMAAPHQAFIVPLDQAYRLTGLIRTAWTGFSGGADVRRLIAAFCAELRQQACPMAITPLQAAAKAAPPPEMSHA